MADAAREYPRRVYEYGMSAPLYQLSFDAQGHLKSRKIFGPDPLDNPSGDILLLLDWNPYSGNLSDAFGIGSAASTKLVGPVVADKLMAENFLADLGVPITRFPLHLIGHSRGGSLVCEIAKRLGERNVVVDHLTLIDAHPVNNDGFNDLIDPVDGTARLGIYENVLFADANYQTRGNGLTVPTGTFVSGTFIRWLDDSGIDSGGYGNPHSNAHLWYHGTMALDFPLTSDGTESIGAATRGEWFAPVEKDGAHAGYFYSIRGGGDRREVFASANRFSGVPPHGLNGLWSKALGSTAVDNRTTLSRTSEARANVIEFNLRGLPVLSNSPFALGAPLKILATNIGSGLLQADLTYSFNGQGGGTIVKVFADRDENTFNGWTKEVDFSLPATGNSPMNLEFAIQQLSDGLEAGFYRIGALISSPSGPREYYAPERLFLYPNLTLKGTLTQSGGERGFDFTISGLRANRYVLESSDDLASWTQVSAGQLSSPTGSELVGTDVRSTVTRSGKAEQFFRARYRD